MFKYMDNTLKEMLDRFPNGFAIDPDGNIYEVIIAVKSKSELPEKVLEKSGFIFVQVPKVRNGDNIFGMELSKEKIQGADEIKDDLEKSTETPIEDYKLYEKYRDMMEDA